MIWQQLLTENDCYKTAAPLRVQGVMVHSTGANNPRLSRYIAPDDGRLGENIGGQHWNQPRPGGRAVCAHAFVGKLADGTIAAYQTLPWEMRGWHSGSGSKGSANNTHIGFEICEDDLTDGDYFSVVYDQAAELCVYLCEVFDLDPMEDGVVISHSEGYARGIASNHGDVEHWFSRHGKTMNDFRKEVAVRMAERKGSGNNPSSWHEEATRWAIEQGLFQGDGKGNYDWQEPVTREQLAQVIYNLEHVGEE